MTDARHTPGPWVIIPARPHEELDGAFEAFAGIEGADGNPVCVFGDAGGSGTMFENAADHSLIAAAPDLLEALKVAEPFVWRAGLAGFPDAEAAHAVLCRAIARAEA